MVDLDSRVPGETLEQVVAERNESFSEPWRPSEVALFAHAHILRVLTARWLGLLRMPVGSFRSAPHPSVCWGTSVRFGDHAEPEWHHVIRRSAEVACIAVRPVAMEDSQE